MRKLIVLCVPVVMSLVLGVGTSFANGIVGVLEVNDGGGIISPSSKVVDGGITISPSSEVIDGGGIIAVSDVAPDFPAMPPEGLDHWLKQCYVANSDGSIPVDCCSLAYCVPPMALVEDNSLAFSATMPMLLVIEN